MFFNLRILKLFTNNKHTPLEIPLISKINVSQDNISITCLGSNHYNPEDFILIYGNNNLTGESIENNNMWGSSIGKYQSCIINFKNTPKIETNTIEILYKNGKLYYNVGIEDGKPFDNKKDSQITDYLLYSALAVFIFFYFMQLNKSF